MCPMRFKGTGRNVNVRRSSGWPSLWERGGLGGKRVDATETRRLIAVVF